MKVDGLLAHHTFRIFWMKQRVGLSALPLLKGEPVVIERGAVVVQTTAIGPELGDVLRREVKNLAKLSFALPNPLFRPPLIIDVRVQTVPSDNSAAFVPQGIDANVNPAIDAVEAPQALNNLHSLPDRRRPQPLVLHRLALVRMDGLHKGSRKLVGRHTEKVEKALVGVLKFPH